MSNVNFPTSTKEIPEEQRQSGGSWAVKITDVYTQFNPNYAGGMNGLYIDMINEGSGKSRAVFFPEPQGEGKNKKVPSRTKALLEHLEKLGISPDKLGGWDGLRGYRLAWKKEEKSFTRESDKQTVNYTIEFPIKILGTPDGSVNLPSNGNGNGAAAAAAGTDDGSPFDQLKSLGLGKSKTEVKFAVANNDVLAKEYGQSLQDLIDSMIDDGVWEIVSGKFQKGPNF